MSKQIITIEELEQVIDALQSYAAGDRTALEQNQDLFKLARDVDYSSKTQKEYETNSDFDPSSHGIGRMIMFLLNYYGEKYLSDGQLTISADDPKIFNTLHTNTYILKLKDPETHEQFGGYNPVAEDKPYDFDSQFIQQITYYPDKTAVDTTATAWDSFQKTYSIPARTFDFKSAFWKKGHEHFVDYILQIDSKSILHVINRSSKQERQFAFSPADGHEQFLAKYNALISIMWQFSDYAWSNFILDD